MKKLFLVLCLVASMGAIHAQQVTSTNLHLADTYILLSTPKVVNSITLMSLTNQIVRVYDNANTNLFHAHGAYTNFVTYNTNIVTSYVTTTGLTNTFTNTVLWTTSSAVAAGSNALAPVFTYAVPAGNIPVTFMDSAIFSRGVAVSNMSTNISIIINHRPSN